MVVSRIEKKGLRSLPLFRSLTSPLYFIIFFRGFGLVLAVTGKWFLSYVSLGSIPAKPVRGLKKVAHRVAFLII